MWRIIFIMIRHLGAVWLLSHQTWMCVVMIREIQLANTDSKLALMLLPDVWNLMTAAITVTFQRGIQLLKCAALNSHPGRIKVTWYLQISCSQTPNACSSAFSFCPCPAMNHKSLYDTKWRIPKDFLPAPHAAPAPSLISDFRFQLSKQCRAFL